MDMQKAPAWVRKAARPRGTDHAQVIQVIQTKALAGIGSDEDPCRHIFQYWDFEGNLLATTDYLQANSTGEGENVVLEQRITVLEKENTDLKRQLEGRLNKNGVIASSETAVACAKKIDDAFRHFLNPSKTPKGDVSSNT